MVTLILVQLHHALQVKLDQLSLEKEKSVLEHENQQLRMLLKQYLDGMVMSLKLRCNCGQCVCVCVCVYVRTGISVSDEVLSRKNPLLVVNKKTPQ